MPSKAYPKLIYLISTIKGLNTLSLANNCTFKDK